MAAVINEFVFNHTGDDTAEFIEVFVTDAAPRDLTVLVIEGDGDGAGIVDRVYAVGPFDAAGFWTTGFLPENTLENGTQTVLLVTGFSSTAGTDLDTNNDGVFDSTPWTAIIDSVAVTDGGASDRTYSPVVLSAANIGAGFTPGGASRIPNGTDTDAVADWRVNDFEGAGLPGFTGNVTGDEVANTPGASNDTAATPGPGIIVSVQGLTLEEGGFGGGFSLRLATQPTADVTITLTPDAELSISSATTLTFTPDNWDVEQGVAVSAVDDTDVEGAHSGTVLINPAVSTDLDYNGLDAPDQVFSIIDNDFGAPTLTPIYVIQGLGHRSALEGQQVTTSGIVTARSNNGFWMQDPDGDGDTRTSDGIFVFTGGPPGRAVGDAVQVAGLVTEFTRNTSDPGHLSITQITAPTVTVQSSGNALPDAVVIGTDRTPPTEITDLDPFTEYNPVRDGVDFWESLEGMRVELPDAIAVGPSFNSTSTAAVVANKAEVFAVANRGAGATGQNDAGGLTLAEDDANPERVAVQANQQVLAGADVVAKVGDLLGDVVGVLDYDNRGNFEIVLTEAITVADGGLEKEEATDLVGDADTLTIGTYNVENLAGTTSAAKFTALGIDIADLMRAPDIIALQEIQDNNGTTDDGTVAADITYARLIEAIALAGGPTYKVLNIDPLNNTSGGAPGGNIRVGFLYNDDRVDLVDDSLRQVDPTNTAAWDASRIPLAADFVFNGEVITVVNNHWASKGGSSPQFGTIQPLQNGGEDQRILQATAVKGFVDDILADDADANIVVMGDLNEFAWEEPLEIVTGRAEGEQVLFDLFELTEPDPTERYEYVFDGNHQILDHMLASAALLDGGFGFDSLQVNSQFPAAQRNSDHDPAVASFSIPAAAADALEFTLWREALFPGATAALPQPALWRNPATNYVYGAEESISPTDSATGASVNRFISTAGDVAISRIDFAGAASVGNGVATVATLDWQAPGSALLRLDAAWNTVKNAAIADFTGDALEIQNFVDVLVALATRTTALDLTVDGIKRGAITTGSGDDVIFAGLDSNDARAGRTVVIDAGAGDDAVTIAAATRDYVASRGWTLAQSFSEVTGGAGDDTLVGADSRDTAVFSGNAADYLIAVSPTGVTTVTDLNLADGDDGTDTISFFEVLRFRDVSLEFTGGVWA
jgi:predicted extracellular nuclease